MAATRRHRKVRVTVAEIISSYSHGWDLPAAVHASLTSSTAGDWVTGISVAIMVILAIVIAVTAVARQQADTLQWGTMLRLAIVFGRSFSSHNSRRR